MDEEKQRKIKDWLGTGSINIFGRPFSGKDTQAQQLAQLLEAPVIGGGEIIRNSQNAQVKNVVDEGKLAPTQAYLDLILPYLSQKKLRSSALILSSVGRWHGEETAVLEALQTSGHPLKATILLKIDENEVQKRWEAAKALGDRGRRADDAHGKLDVRLEEFRNKTLPVIDFYKQQGLLIEVDGSQPPQQVTEKIITKLLKFSSRS